MRKRGYKHGSDLAFSPNTANSKSIQNEHWQSLDQQIAILKAKGCQCKV